MRNELRAVFAWQWVLLLALLPFFMFPEGYRWLALLVIPILWTARKVVLGRFVPATPYNLAIALVLAMVALGAALTFDLSLSLPRIAMLLYGAALFFAVVDFGRTHSLWMVVIAYILAGLVVALAGLVGLAWEAPFDFLNSIGRVLPLMPGGVPGTSTGVINANELAGVLSWIAPLLIGLSIGLSRHLWKTRKWLYILLLLLTAFFILLTFATLSRGGILALAGSAVLIVALYVSNRWRLVLLIGVIIAAVGLVIYTNNLPEHNIVGDALGIGGRIEIWSRAIIAIEDHPLTGAGINGFRRVVHELYPLFSIAESIDLGHAHNHLLQVALDLGLPGLIGYLAMWIISVGQLIGTQRHLVDHRARRHPYFALVTGLAGSLTAGWLFGLFDAVALGSRPSFLWWLLLAMTASAHYAVVYSGGKLHRRRRHSVEAASTETRRRPPGAPIIRVTSARPLEQPTELFERPADSNPRN